MTGQRILLPALAALWPACTPSNDGSAAAVRRDSAGIAIVEAVGCRICRYGTRSTLRRIHLPSDME